MLFGIEKVGDEYHFFCDEIEDLSSVMR